MVRHEPSLEERLRALEQLASDEIAAERKRSTSVFSDEQRRQMDEILGRALVAFLASDPLTKVLDLRIEYRTYQQGTRFAVWMVLTVISSATAALVAYFKLKG